tara:strand:+ start:968 stop:1618 length:651 start_codon:yes stop_codon:yes gene_type:complete
MQYLTLLGALLLVGLMIPNIAKARPVSYPGGWTGMFMNDDAKSSVHIHYSPTSKISVGYKFEQWHKKEMTLNAIQVNNLVKRWNNLDSQANLYLKSGIGIARSHAGKSNHHNLAVGFTGISIDWEDRRFFTSYENRYTAAANITDFYQESARVGVAPYIGHYNDLHTWLMLQIDHMPRNEHHFTVTPLVRFFQGPHLLETGVNNYGKVFFDYIFRY